MIRTKMAVDVVPTLNHKALPQPLFPQLFNAVGFKIANGRAPFQTIHTNSNATLRSTTRSLLHKAAPHAKIGLRPTNFIGPTPRTFPTALAHLHTRSRSKYGAN